MKIIIDDKIPFIKDVLEPFANVVYMSGAKISKEDVKDADALIVRTRTKCNGKLLNGSMVKFIATATIGYDHIDTDYCKKNGIAWTNAPGCNSGSVMQYVGSVLSWLKIEKQLPIHKMVIGVVGVGNVGSKVDRLCRILGMKVLLCDPIRKTKEGGDFVDYDTILRECDIITYHVPLERSGKFPTFHMFDIIALKKVKPGLIILNSSRGEVVDTTALKEGLVSGIISDAILDVWENEPEVDLELLKQVSIATPHIAGYSVDGKANGTAMSVQSLACHFNLPLGDWFPKNISEPEINVIEEKNIFEVLLETYAINEDSARLKSEPALFEYYRGNYPIRREYMFYKVKTRNISDERAVLLQQLGFKIIPREK